MRLHDLEVTAFGPFTDPVHVDFDELSTQGLFLLSGATGAGKTSVLDAVCFALYGEVPGDRAGAKLLRSDRAAPDAEPRVRLVATLAGRHLEVSRSPAWVRPKKRGSGTTAQQATVRVREQLGGPDGAWTTLTTRHDEAGLLMTRLLGMNQAQFTQVAMLPQGRFQAFLRAEADERQKLLQQLFGTSRFERVEAWLRERRTTLRRAEESARRELAEALSRTSEASGTLPDGLDLDDLTGTMDADAVIGWGADLAASVRREHLELAATSASVEADELGARRRLEDGRINVERHRRHEEARAELARLDERSAEHARSTRALDQARRACAVVPVHALWCAAARSLATTGAAERRSVAAAAALGLDEATAAERHEQRWSNLAATEHRFAQDAASLVPTARRLAEVRGLSDRARGRIPDLRDQGSALRRCCADGPATVERLRTEVDRGREAAARASTLRAERSALDSRIVAWSRAETLAVDLEGAREAHRVARDHTLSSRELLLDLREMRLAGMAGEIACALAVGESCPVCGSHEHPAKARPTPGSPDAAGESAAQHAIDDASAVEHLRDQEVRTLETELAAARARAAGSSDSARDTGDVEALLARRDSVGADLDDAERLAVQGAAQALVLRDAERRQESDTAALAAAEVEIARLEAASETLEGEATALVAALALGGPADELSVEDLERRRDHHTTRAESALGAAEARAAHDRAEEHASQVAAQLSLVVADAGFPDLAAASDAVLGESALHVLAAAVRRHDERRATLTAALAEHAEETDQAGGVAAEAPGDLKHLEREHHDALGHLHEHHARRSDLARRAERLSDLSTRLNAAVTAWAPVQRELELVGGLASFVEGRAADNRWQMRLSAYVLAYRLSQVVAAANVRLARMSDQRYCLEHTIDRGRERRGGLGLLVRDEWSGEARSSATLSGGETFVVSLALALGLADVVSGEAGGVELETLFVDEGFGSLDSGTLDDVMDTLDALREGGRVVGVVSHVAEMRERIPTQLVVTKHRDGSTLAIRH